MEWDRAVQACGRLMLGCKEHPGPWRGGEQKVGGEMDSSGEEGGLLVWRRRVRAEKWPILLQVRQSGSGHGARPPRVGAEMPTWPGERPPAARSAAAPARCRVQARGAGRRVA